MRKKYIIANWKMNKTQQESKQLINMLLSLKRNEKVTFGICPTYTSIETVKKCINETSILLGAQNVNENIRGAYTGEISAEMLQELDVEICIVGHSDRRDKYFEKDTTINQKIKILLEYGITPIVCVGEHDEDRKNGTYKDFVEFQIRKALENVDIRDVSKCIIAYEPIWAISTNSSGVIATAEEAEEMCAFIRYVVAKLYGVSVSEEIHILYGGSVNMENAVSYLNLKDIDGALVGGASMKTEIIEIINAIKI